MTKDEMELYDDLFGDAAYWKDQFQKTGFPIPTQTTMHRQKAKPVQSELGTVSKMREIVESNANRNNPLELKMSQCEEAPMYKTKFNNKVVTLHPVQDFHSTDMAFVLKSGNENLGIVNLYKSGKHFSETNDAGKKFFAEIKEKLNLSAYGLVEHMFSKCMVNDQGQPMKFDTQTSGKGRSR